jgi:hypothetical protein
MGWLYSNPASSANKYLKQIPGTITPYFQPYINAGNKAMGTLNNQYGQLMSDGSDVQDQYGQILSDPGGKVNQIGQSYQQSPGYQWSVDQGMDAVNNAASAGGYLGTPQEQQYAATMTQGLADQDYNSYMDNALGLYKTGLTGDTGLYDEGLHGVEHINDMGYNASSSLAEGLAQALMAQANLSYTGQANQNQHRGTLLAGGVTMAHNLMHPKAKNYVSPVTYQGMPQSSSSSKGGVAGLVGSIFSHL